ncbi:uncharacterized protein [Nicotiana tomentosiformis]|uniref:uncharacterized protein n=1 Tax=Nicotiana tomentosiformis TaxID=4098 RepID=UPI00388CE1AC
MARDQEIDIAYQQVVSIARRLEGMRIREREAKRPQDFGTYNNSPALAAAHRGRGYVARPIHSALPDSSDSQRRGGKKKSAANFEGITSITDEESDLEAPFAENEVLATIQSSAPDKASGPDGYTMAFYRQSWEFINVYKITSKVLAERLKKVVKKLVSNQQNAFIKGRRITDVSLIANEVLDWQMGFGERWIKWTKFNMSTVKYSILINRSPVGFFSPQRGLRQGDPLSPILSILAMEGLSRILDKAKQMQWISGFDVGRSNSSVIYPVNEVHNLEELAGILGCCIGTFPTTYMGLPKSEAIWDGVTEKLENMLTSWQLQYISMGGRLTQINSVLDSIPTYHMSLYPMSSRVLKQLDNIRRKFLWEGKTRIIISSGPSGLRFNYQSTKADRHKKLVLHNKCLLMKWLWRYTQDEQCLWKEIVNAKHGVLNHWCTKLSRAPNGVGVSKNICKLWEEFSMNKHFIAKDPDSTILQCREGDTWNILCRKNLQDWEFEELVRLLATLNSYSSNNLVPDQFKWGNAHAGRYSVKAAYKLSEAQNAITDHWPWKLIWKVKRQHKVACFNWTALHGSCLTRDNLVRRNFQIVNRCYMCQREAESHSYLFLHCPVAADLWNVYFSI